jgi:diguanylate cyclase (GGDEF)-like protein
LSRFGGSNPERAAEGLACTPQIAKENPVQVGEDDRLRTLREYRILDTDPDESFERITRIVSAALHVPMAAITLVDTDRQWFKSRIGIDIEETPRSASFCAHTMIGETAMLVPDTLRDPRFFDNPLVLGDPRIRFYAGYPLVSPSGMPLGAVCVLDIEPRTATPVELGLLRDVAALVMEQLNLRLLASTDGLTGSLRREAFFEAASRELRLSYHYEWPTSCLMIDADHFKSINDNHGHDVGDEVLEALVQAIKSELRSTDILGRIGGEEFAVLLPRTSPTEALRVAERIREQVARINIQAIPNPLKLTISAGVAGAGNGEESVTKLLYKADMALLRAKQAGRNKVLAW